MGLSTGSLVSLTLLGVLCWYAAPAEAFGAGNIAGFSTAEGVNWRHGDIEDALLGLYMAQSFGGKKFSDLQLKRVYFGNWLRDYSQAIDTGALKYVDKQTIRIVLWVLSFLTFGYATGEFEVTEERLGCYRPEEHIDNPKDYADNTDARDFDERLRGPVDEGVELAIDPNTGMKNYIANEEVGIETSAALLRRTLGRSIEVARSYARTGDKAEKYEALRLLGTGLHCLEDFPAHSNYVELTIREFGEYSIFPHVGSQTPFDLHGHYVFPLVTGTFGGVDFLHSVLGEASDKMVQSEVEQLEDTINQSANKAEQDGGEAPLLRQLLDSLPPGIFGSSNSDNESLGQEAERLENENRQKKEEGGLDNLNSDEIRAQLYPILEFHDRIMKAISTAIENIPGLATLLETLSETVAIFVFSLLAPYIVPILERVKGELSVASEEVINSSKDKQHIVFNDDYSSDPTHSMLSKDHFSNQLNEPAGRVAKAMISYAVPILMNAWDDDGIDIDETMNHIIQLFHHPAVRDIPDYHAGREKMFEVVKTWWHEEKSEEEREHLRNALSREGVEAGLNHKEGQVDCGHGCGKPLGENVRKAAEGNGNGGGGIGGLGAFGGAGGGGNFQEQLGGHVGSRMGEALGGGEMGARFGEAIGKSVFGNVGKSGGGFGGWW